MNILDLHILILFNFIGSRIYEKSFKKKRKNWKKIK